MSEITSPHIQRTIDAIADRTKRADKLAWNRRMDTMISLLAEVRPIEEQLTDLQVARREIHDRIAAHRKQMVVDCIHPVDQLVAHADHRGDYVECKFCGIKFTAPLNDSPEAT